MCVWQQKKRYQKKQRKKSDMKHKSFPFPISEILINLINYIGYDKWAPTNCTKTLFLCPNNGEKACLSDEHLGNKIYWRFRAQNQTKIFINQLESASDRNNVQTKTNIFITHGKLMFAQRPLI